MQSETFPIIDFNDLKWDSYQELFYSLQRLLSYNLDLSPKQPLNNSLLLKTKINLLLIYCIFFSMQQRGRKTRRKIEISQITNKTHPTNIKWWIKNLKYKSNNILKKDSSKNTWIIMHKNCTKHNRKVVCVTLNRNKFIIIQSHFKSSAHNCLLPLSTILLTKSLLRSTWPRYHVTRLRHKSDTAS